MSAVLKSKPPTIGAAVDTLWELQQKKKAANEEVKRIEALIAAAETTVYELMDAQGTRRSEGKKVSVSIGETTTFNIEDFDAFAKYVHKTKYFHLFQRRVSVEGARELFETKGAVPGISPFTKRKLTLTTVK
jgi:hypothetical protein